MQKPPKYSYIVRWSKPDDAFVAHCVEIPSLAAHGDTAIAALRELESVVLDVVEQLTAKGKEPLPKQFSGKILLRIPPEQHRDLFIQAQAQGVSVNRLLSMRLSQ